MQRLVDQFDDPAYVVGFEGNVSKVLSWNHAVERALGYAAEEAVGRGIDEVLPPAYSSRSRLRRVTEMRRRGSWHGRTVLVNRRGIPVTFRGSCGRLDAAGTNYLTVLRFQPLDYATSLREFAQSVAQSEQRSVGEQRSGCDGVEAMTQDAKQHRKDKVAFHIRRLRQANGLTCEQLETRIGASRGHVSRWENSLWEPSPFWLDKLAEVLGVEEAEFFREPVPC